MSSTNQPEEDPAAIVADAESAANTAEQLAEALEERVRTGDSDVTPEQIATQKSLASFLRIKVEAARGRAEQIRAKARTKAIRALRAEVKRRVPEAGTELVAALHAVDDAARDFVRLADEYDLMLDGWRQQTTQLGLGDGVSEEGVGRDGIGQLVVEGQTYELVDGFKFLRLLFVSGNDLTLRPADPDNWLRLDTYRALDAIAAIK